MTPAIREVPKVPALPQMDAGAIEKVLMQGDLGKLDAGQRLAYYGSVCQSLGLNPLTRPFEYISLNGKLTLYAKKECTEQLRMKYDVSVTIVSREVAEGCYVVTARATMPHGRSDESIGAVSIEGLKGEARSNAMMRAETKAKRRVTLSICGLAFLDDSERDSVPGAAVIPVDPETGEIPDPAPAETLHEDIVANPVKETKAQRASTTPFDALKAFGGLKKRFQIISAEWVYYKILSKYGKKKSNEFGSDEIQPARGCYKEMQLVVSDLEVLPVVEVLPDPIPMTAGKMMRQGGKYWLVMDVEGRHQWAEAQ